MNGVKKMTTVVVTAAISASFFSAVVPAEKSVLGASLSSAEVSAEEPLFNKCLS